MVFMYLCCLALRHSPSKRKSVDRQKSLGDGNVMLVSRDLTSVSMEADADQGF